MTIFGTVIRELRAKAGISLRDFAKEMGVDAGNWSKIERNLSNPPTDIGFFEKLSALLGVDSNKVNDLMTLAKAMVILPKELKETDLLTHMPALLRRANGDPLSDAEIDRLIEWVKDTAKDEYSSN